jgi:beta-phosphoglucomutase-like phosphatase (HAD superfamily)
MDRILDYLLEGDRLITLIAVVGIPFIMALGGGWLFYRMLKMQREERIEWREDLKQILTRQEERDSHSVTVIEGVTRALQGLTTMVGAFVQSSPKRRRRR